MHLVSIHKTCFVTLYMVLSKWSQAIYSGKGKFNQVVSVNQVVYGMSRSVENKNSVRSTCNS